jgi:uridine kinase
METRIILVGGGTGSGKSALAAELAARLAPALRIAEDDYYLCSTGLPDFDPATFNFDAPAAKDLALLAAHLDALRAGATIAAPRYDFALHRRMPEQCAVAPQGTIIVEGLHAILDDAVRARADFCVFVHAPEEVRLARRLVRDVRERGRDIEGIVAQFLTSVRPMHARYVEPQRQLAHLVVDAEAEPSEVLAARVCAALDAHPR